MMIKNTLHNVARRARSAAAGLGRAGWVLGVAALAGCYGVGPYSGETPPSTLDNTYWQLVRIADRPVKTGGDARPPYILLTQPGNKLHGFAGCNNLTGRYERDGQSLQFKQIANTRMACSGGMQLEHRFVQALRQTRRARVHDHTLTLLSASDEPLARFDARTAQFQGS